MIASSAPHEQERLQHSRLNNDRIDAARALLVRRIDLRDDAMNVEYPVRRRVEEGTEDADGSPLVSAEVPIDPLWLTWNNGCIPNWAAAALQSRSFWELPILADALEDAGCPGEGPLTRHLRAPITHTKDCWVLRRLCHPTESPGAELP